MGMADDDLAYVVANTHTLSHQQSKFYYSSGFTAGSGAANDIVNETISYLNTQAEFLFDLLEHEKELGEKYLPGTSIFLRSLAKLNHQYDQIGGYITFGGTQDNCFTFDVVEKWAVGKRNLVQRLVEHPALYREVFGCSKHTPSPTLEWVNLKDFRKYEALNQQQQWLADLMKSSKSIQGLSGSYADKLECVCSSCIACCGNTCNCSYTHLDNDEYELGCDDPDECDLYEHSVCHACQDDCECC
jgi:hypothetical protein